MTARGRFAWAHDLNLDRCIAGTLPGASFVVNGAAEDMDDRVARLRTEGPIHNWQGEADSHAGSANPP